MILEKETYEKFGYYASDFKPKSRKKIVAVCDDCGKVRILSKFSYSALCKSCCKKGKRSVWFGKKGKDSPAWRGGKINRICEICDTKFPIDPSDIKNGRGRFCSPKCKDKWHSKQFRGENNHAWKNGASFEPYCIKFNFPFKEYIRDKFGRTCFLCDKTEAENGQRLSVHHVNENKGCGCDGDETCQFVPLCVKCHAKVHSKKVDWEKKIKDKLRNKLNGWYI